MNNSYLRFLRLADTLTKSGEKSLDSLSKDILEYIFKNTSRNKERFVVGDILTLRQFGSQATLHKRLHDLVDEGYLRLKSTKDGRVKQILLTKKANSYFADLSQALEKASKTESDLSIKTTPP